MRLSICCNPFSRPVIEKSQIKETLIIKKKDLIIGHIQSCKSHFLFLEMELVNFNNPNSSNYNGITRQLRAEIDANLCFIVIYFLQNVSLRLVLFRRVVRS